MTSTDKDLSLTPLKGNSGKAYMGTYPNGDRVFVKMNTTPILAALAKEQIAPQLLWAKRLGNGDMIAAFAGANYYSNVCYIPLFPNSC